MRARARHIRPLASPDAEGDDAVSTQPPTASALPPLPDIDTLPPDVFDPPPSSPKDRIERWQSKLLDLTLNNRLLNFKPTKRSVPFAIPDIGALEDMLADGHALRIRAQDPDEAIGNRDEAAMRRSGLNAIMDEAARDAFDRGELLVPLGETEATARLTARLTALYRQARNDLAEGGTNTLFLAVGSLRWRKRAGDERVYRAPLLLVPVSLERKSAGSGFRLKHFDEDVRFNTTLLEYLRREFEITIPQLEGELPTDDSGIDVPFVQEIVRQRVRDVPGFEVVEEATLGTFSFAKYLMWKDLTERTDALRRNRVVRHLIDTPDEAFAPGGSGSFPRSDELDRNYAPTDFACPLPADSSQLAAVKAAAEGHDFVIIGPPGTGKSQTIANMIAQVLFEGRSVLFVAEKVAALDVVYRRLAELGLGEVCLELHSNKADRRRFLDQLRRSWDLQQGGSEAEWVSLGERLKVRRDQLNVYAAALHAPGPHGESVFGAIARRSAWGDRGIPDIAFEGTLDAESIERLAMLADEAALKHEPVAGRDGFDLVGRTEFSNAWLSEFQAASARLREALSRQREEADGLAAVLHLPGTIDWTTERLDTVRQLLAALGRTRKGDTLAFEPDADTVIEAWPRIRARAEAAHAARARLSVPYPDDELSRVPVDDLERQWRSASARMWPFSALGRRRVRAELGTYAGGTRPDPATDLASIRKLNQAREAVAAEPGAERIGADPARIDVAATQTRLDGTAALRTALRALAPLFGLDQAAHQRIVGQIHGIVGGSIPLDGRRERFDRATADVEAARGAFEALAGRSLPEGSSLATTIHALEEVEGAGSALRDWVAWCRSRDDATAAGLGDVVGRVRGGRLMDDAGEAVRVAYAAWWLPRAMDADPVLRDFQGHAHGRTIEEFRTLTERVRDESARMVLRRAGHSLPPPDEVAPRSELGMLRHQLNLRRPSKSIRKMVEEMPTRFGELAPCLLMSPLSIAQYLPHDAAPFDVVIFDEASQITTWDAVGAIARGEQAVIVGDPKQLPPTNFFGRSTDGDGEADGAEFWTIDQASILDEAAAAGLPRHTLRWHYRSRHEELIAFSNERYYDNALITFPSPHANADAVPLWRVEGVYDRGKSRTNRAEARAVADRAAALMARWLDLPEDERPTLGIVTFNAQQQALIADLLDEARLADPDLEWFFADERIEPTIVRNLENVQGDERDVILFSLTFAPDAAGKFTMNFGALNSDGGERRLNVAVTRARRRLEAFSSFGAEDVDLGRTGASGVADLKRFLDYAARGPVALAAGDEGSLGGYDSPFEREVAEALRARGWNVRTQIGVSGYRIDLGIVHPKHAGAYLCGIECDGATYHSSATARDRDLVRESVLRGLGWEIERVWSTEWWQDRGRVTNQLHARLQALSEHNPSHADDPFEATTIPDGVMEKLERDLTMDPVGMNAVPGAPILDEDTDRPIVPDADDGPPPGTRDDSDREQEDDAERRRPEGMGEAPQTPFKAVPADDSNASKVGGTQPIFRRADLTVFSPDPQAFDDALYGETIRRMSMAVIDAEGPVRLDVLAQRIARAHGWQRTGSRIRERVERVLPPHDRTEEREGTFVWPSGTVAETIPWRRAAEPDDQRNVSEISDAELRGLIRSQPSLTRVLDPPLAVARHIGLARLASSTRGRLEALLNESA